MPFRETVRDFRRAADNRLGDALELIEKPTRDSQRSDANRRHLRGAMYLGGYAVECLLKAYLIRQTNMQTLAEATDILDLKQAEQGGSPTKNIRRSAAGHKIAYLLSLTDLPKERAVYDAKLWGRLGEWQSSWRYETDAVELETALAFLSDVQTAVDLLSPKL